MGGGGGEHGGQASVWEGGGNPVGNYGSPDGSREFCAQDAEISGKFGVPPTLFLNGIGASVGKFGVPSMLFPNGIGASVGKFGVPMSVHTESAPGLRDPPVYMSGRNSWQA